VSDLGNQAVWSSVVDGLIFVSTNAIPQLWLKCKADGLYLGPPITDEMARDDGGVEQAFSSGAVIAWTPDAGAWLE
jgi:uncharacterized protein with LGFP repeats